MLYYEPNFEKLNKLPPEVRLTVAKALKLKEGTKALMHKKGVDVSLPYRMQLKADMAEMDRTLRKLESGKYKKKHLDSLDFQIRRLITESETILEWEFKFEQQ